MPDELRAKAMRFVETAETDNAALLEQARKKKAEEAKEKLENLPRTMEELEQRIKV